MLIVFLLSCTVILFSAGIQHSIKSNSIHNTAQDSETDEGEDLVIEFRKRIK